MDSQSWITAVAKYVQTKCRIALTLHPIRFEQVAHAVHTADVQEQGHALPAVPHSLVLLSLFLGDARDPANQYNIENTLQRLLWQGRHSAGDCPLDQVVDEPPKTRSSNRLFEDLLSLSTRGQCDTFHKVMRIYVFSITVIVTHCRDRRER